MILRCLEKDKESRYQSAGELRSELTNIEKSLPITERAVPKRKPITLKEITVTFGLKKLFIPAVVVVALVIIALIIWQLLNQKEAAPLTTGRLYYGDIYAKSFYQLGKIYEQKGWTGKAIEHYEKFLSLWKDAGPGIIEVDNACERLRLLK